MRSSCWPPGMGAELSSCTPDLGFLPGTLPGSQEATYPLPGYHLEHFCSKMSYWYGHVTNNLVNRLTC